MELNSTFREEERRQGRNSKVSGDKKKSLWRLYIKGGGRGGNSSFGKGRPRLCGPLFFRKVFFYRFPLHKKGETGRSGGEVVSSSLPPPLAQLWKGEEARKNGKPGQEEQEEEEDLWEPQPRRRRILYFLPSRLPPPPVRTGQNSPPLASLFRKKTCRQQRGKLNVAASNSGGEGKKGCVCIMQKG